jgi:myo-inositol-1-phosphate synthase
MWAASRSPQPSTSMPQRWAVTCRRRSSPLPTTQCASRTRNLQGVRVARGPTLDGLGKISARGDRRVERARGGRDAGAEGQRHGDPRQLPARRLGARRGILRRAGAPGRLRLRQLHSRSSSLHRRNGESGSRSGACRSSATTSRARSARPSCTACSTNLFRERGVRIDRTYQLNFGGNSDFKNMLERDRLESKKISKTQSVTSQFDVPLAPGRHPCRAERPRSVAERPQMVPISAWKGTAFGGVPLNLELKLEVWDSARIPRGS